MASAARQDAPSLAGFAIRLRKSNSFEAQNAARRLDELDAALKPGPDADAWERVDLRRVIDPDAIAEQMHRVDDRVAAIIAVCEWARNILILVPIVITWLGLSDALKAYEAAVTADGQLAQQSFLLLWQQGFGGRLSPGGELSTVATKVAGSIGLVILLTAVSHGFDNLVQRRQEHERERTRAEIESLLGDAAVVLAKHAARRDADRFDPIQSLGATLDQQRAGFQKFGDDFQELLKQQLEMFNAKADTLVKHLGNEVGRVRDYADGLDSAVRDLKAFAVDLTQAVSAHGDLVSRSEQSAAAIAASAAALEAQVRRLVEEQVRLIAAATGLTGVAETMVTEQTRLGGELTAAVDQHRAATRTFIESSSRLESVGEALAASQATMLDGLHDGAGTLAGSSQLLESILAPLPTAMGTLLTALTTTGEQQANASTAVQRALVDLQRLLDRQESQSERLQHLNKTLHALAEAIARLSQESQAQATGDREAVRAQNAVLSDLTRALQDVSRASTAVNADQQRMADNWAQEQQSRISATSALHSLATSLHETLQRFEQTTQQLGMLIHQLEQPATLRLPPDNQTTIAGPVSERPGESPRWPR